MANHHSITIYPAAPPPCQVEEQTKKVTFKSQPTTPKQTNEPQRPAKSRHVRMLENQKAIKLKEKIDRNERTVADRTSMLMALTPDVSAENADAAMRSKVLNGTIRTGIADAGASSSCGRSG